MTRATVNGACSQPSGTSKVPGGGLVQRLFGLQVADVHATERGTDVVEVGHRRFDLHATTATIPETAVEPRARHVSPCHGGKWRRPAARDRRPYEAGRRRDVRPGAPRRGMDAWTWPVHAGASREPAPSGRARSALEKPFHPGSRGGVSGFVAFQLPGFPVHSMCSRGGTRGCCSGCPGRSCCDSPSGSSWRCCSSCRRGSRGSSLGRRHP